MLKTLVGKEGLIGLVPFNSSFPHFLKNPNDLFLCYIPSDRHLIELCVHIVRLYICNFLTSYYYLINHINPQYNSVLFTDCSKIKL